MVDKVRVAALISGRGSNMLALSEYKRRDPERPYEIALVASNVPEARGLVLARRLGIPTWSLSHKGLDRGEFDAKLDEALRDRGVEVVALAGYMRLLSDRFVETWAGRVLNVHPSLLPLYKGLDTHRRAIVSGDEFGGCSVHLVTADLDSGPVLGQAKVRILPRDDSESLASRVLEEEHRLYPVVLEEFCQALIEQRACPPPEGPMDPDAQASLNRVREISLALPRAVEKISHGAPVFYIEKGRTFAWFLHDHHQSGITAVAVKTSSRDEQEMLVETRPELYYLPPYFAPSGWVGLRLDTGDTDWTHVADRIATSWELVAPKRLLEIGGRL